MTTLSRRDFLRTGSAAALGLGLGLRRHPSSSSWTTATPVDGGALDELAKQLTGQLLRPGDNGYTDASAPNNGRYLATKPLAVAVCENEQDVVACVNWCRTNGVAPAARGGGHSYGGYSTTTGLVINIGKLNAVDTTTKQGSAIVGGAALNRDVAAKTDDTNFFLPVGTCPGVGVGGLVLGGGIGYNTHSYGLTCDHLTATRIVTASGAVLDIDEENDADLFWACRGGAGGSFGINLSFTFNLTHIPQGNVSFYRFDYAGADTAIQVFGAFHEILQVAPPQLNAVAWASADPLQNRDKRDAITAVSRGQFFGPPGPLQVLLKPLLDLNPKDPGIKTFSYWDMQRMLRTQPSPPHSYGDISRYVAEPPPNEALTKMVNVLVDCPSRDTNNNGSIISLGWVGGSVVNQKQRTDTAYVHRNMLTLLRPSPVWSNDADPSVGTDLLAWTKDVITAIGTEPYESYQNFPNRDIPNALDAYYAENLQRLKQVKTMYDKDNLFQNAQSIPPG